MHITMKLCFLYSAVIAIVLCDNAKTVDLECAGGVKYENVQLTAYYADYEDDEKNSFVDNKGKKTRNLQDFLDDRASYVTVAMDNSLNIPYGTNVCIPEINKRFGRRIHFQVRDSSPELLNTKYKRLDVCVRSEVDSYDKFVNRVVTIVIM